MTHIPTTADDRLRQVVALFDAKDYRGSLEVAIQMALDSQIHPVQSILLVLASEETGNLLWYQRGLQLIDHVLAGDPGASKSLCQIERLLAAEMVRSWFIRGDMVRVLQHLDVARKVDPAIAEVFTETTFDLITRGSRPAIPDQTSETAVATFSGLAKGEVVQPRRCLVFGRKYFFGPNSRPHDIGPRMARGLTNGGWESICIDPTFPDSNDRTPRILTPDSFVECCDRYEPDVVLIDHFGMRLSVSDWGVFVAGVRRKNPGIRLVHLNFDPWIVANFPIMKALCADMDLVWSHFPAGDYWDTLGLRDKLVYHPFPVGVELDELELITRQDKTAFQGATESYNYNRVYWLALLGRAGIEIEQRVTVHQDDGLDPIESYRQYLSRFQSVGRLLSFSMRSDGSRIVTGRSFETIYSGGCLIQERADDLDHFLVPGEHYFRFTTFNELRDLLAHLEENPELARIVAAKGQAFYLKNYNDKKLTEYLEAALFPR